MVSLNKDSASIEFSKDELTSLKDNLNIRLDQMERNLKTVNQEEYILLNEVVGRIFAVTKLIELMK